MGSLIFCILYWDCISFISALIFIISFPLCSLGFFFVVLFQVPFLKNIFYWLYLLIMIIDNYILLQLPQYFSHCTPSPSTPHTLRQSLHHCSGTWAMHISSLATALPVLYFTCPWIFCNYLFVLLNPLTSSPITLHPSHLWQLSKHSLYPWFCFCPCLLSLLFRFNCWYICIFAILLFIVLIFFLK